MNPIVKHKKDAGGEHIPFTVDDCCINFNDEMTLNLKHYERDEDVHLAIVRNRLDMLVIGANMAARPVSGANERGDSGGRYVAEIFIPAREFEETPVEGGFEMVQMAQFAEGLEGAEYSEDDSILDESFEGGGIERTPVPLCLSRVTLTLWEVE